MAVPLERAPPSAERDECLVAALRTQQLPDKTAKLARDGHERLVPLQPARTEPGEAAVQTVLRFPADGAHLTGLTLLTTTQLFAHLGRRHVMLRALDQQPARVRVTTFGD